MAFVGAVIGAASSVVGSVIAATKPAPTAPVRERSFSDAATHLELSALCVGALKGSIVDAAPYDVCEITYGDGPQRIRLLDPLLLREVFRISPTYAGAAELAHGMGMRTNKSALVEP